MAVSVVCCETFEEVLKYDTNSRCGKPDLSAQDSKHELYINYRLLLKIIMLGGRWMLRSQLRLGPSTFKFRTIRITRFVFTFEQKSSTRRLNSLGT